MNLRRPHRAMSAASVLIAAAILTACASGEPMPTSPGGSSSRPPLPTSSAGPLGPTGTPAELPAAKWAAIEADLAARGVTAAPELTSADAVTFSDGSLGCPAPGQSYTQAMIDGLRVIVTAGGDTYDYRFGGGDEPRLCER